MDNKIQVLIFDDDIALSEMLREFLQVSAGCEVTLVHTAQDFWPAIHGCNYDALFLDYQLQGGARTLTGLDILEGLRRENCPVPTIMMTGLGSEKVAARAIQAGAMDYLVKGDLSFNFDSLPALIQKAIQHRKLQDAVRQSEAKIHYQAMLLENVRDAVAAWDLSGNITYWNSAAEQLYGRANADVLGKPAARIYFPLFTPPVQNPSSSSEPSQTVPSEQVERVVVTPAAGRIWVSSHVSPYYDARRVLAGYIDVTRDITVDKLEQEELERSQHLIQRILEASPNIIYILNLRNNQINYISPKIEAVLGLHVTDILRARNPFFFSMVEPRDLPVLVEHYNQLGSLADGSTSEIEYRVKLSASEWRWFKNRETPFSRDESGRLVEIIGVCEDITPRKLMEEKLLQRLNSEKLLASVSAQLLSLSPTHPYEGLFRAVKPVCEYLGVENGLLFLNDTGKMRCVAAYQAVNREAGPASSSGHAPFPPPVPFDPVNFPWLKTELRRQPLLVVDSIAALPEPAQAECKPFLVNDPQSIVFAPLLRGDDLLGFLLLGMRAAQLRWDDECDYLLRTFGQALLAAVIHLRDAAGGAK